MKRAIGVKGYVDGGANYGFFNNKLQGHVNPFVKASADLYWTFPPDLIITAGASFLYQIGLYTGVAQVPHPEREGVSVVACSLPHERQHDCHCFSCLRGLGKSPEQLHHDLQGPHLILVQRVRLR